MDYSSDAAADALAGIERSRALLVNAADAPPRRHAAFAAIMGCYVATPALPLMERALASTLLIVAVVLVIQWDRRRTGMFISGYRAGRTRRVTALMLAVILALFGLSTWLALDRHSTLGPVLLGVAAAIVAYAGSMWWCRVFRREMLGGIA